MVKQIGSVAINIAFGRQTKENADEDYGTYF